MAAGDEWRVREDTDPTVVVALYLRTALGIREPHELPPLRGVTAPDEPAPAELVAQWQQFWQMTVEPEAHPAEVPLELMPGFDTLVALPTTSEVLRRAARPLAAPALDHLRWVRERQHTPPAGEQVWRSAVQAE
ncbi:MAG: zinc-binding alcohol dehydrogenase, partial [Microbacterium sp.]